MDEIVACAETLPLISNQLRVVDEETNEKWNIKGALDKSRVSVIPVESPQGQSLIDMPILSNQSVETSNGRFSSLKAERGNENNLVEGRQYFLRTTLYYHDNITVGNRRMYLRRQEGCAMPTDGKMERMVVRDSKPFVFQKTLLRKIVDDKFPWGARHDTSKPSGKAAFDRDVDRYNQGIDREITKIMTLRPSIEFPPPVVLLHGILSCYEDWIKWMANLGERKTADQNYARAGIIAFTPNYDYWVGAQGKWRTTAQLKILRDRMATTVAKQISLDLSNLLSNDKTEPGFYLIAHSNGGIVARPLSKITDQNWSIKKIYTMGSPHRGTLILWANDFGLDENQMTFYNCLEGGFNPQIKVAALAGRASINRPILPSEYVKALGGEKFSDGVVIPQGSTYIILCQKTTKLFSRIQTITLLSESELYHSNFRDGNFLDNEGVKLFEKIIAPDMGLK